MPPASPSANLLQRLPFACGFNVLACDATHTRVWRVKSAAMILRWIATAMTTERHRCRLALFAGVAAVIAWAALRFRGDFLALQVDVFMQTCACLAAIAYGLIGALRTTGLDRVWRLFAAAAVAFWLASQMRWWWHAMVVDRPPPTPRVATVGYHVFLLLALAAVLCLVWSVRRIRRQADGTRPVGHTVSVLVVDGLVSTASFAILVWSARINWEGVVLGQSGGRPNTAFYSAIGLLVVVAASVGAIGCGSDRQLRPNLLLLSLGVITLIASDRCIAYLEAVGDHGGKIWARVGFVVGPILIAYAVLRSWSGGAGKWSARAMDWTQLLLPYLGVTGITLLLAIHIATGHHLDGTQLVLAVSMVFMLVARHVMALRENGLLLGRVLAAQSHLIHQVNHDSLTELPSRALLAERLDEAAAAGEPFVLLYVDLDDFKDVNDRFGHAAGDRLLRAVGQRLRACAAESDTVARIAGDEFAILVRDAGEPPEVLADRYRAVLRPPFAVHGQSVRIRASMGVVTPDPLEPVLSADELLRRADGAMYTGKRAGKDTAILYRHSADAEIDFPAALRRANGALPDGFHIHYQPIVRMPEATPVAMEALSRWTASNGTPVPPETFVGSAEAAGLGAEFDLLVLDRVCNEIAAAGIPLTIHVNIGAGRLGDRRFESDVIDTLRRHGVPPSQLVLEITESVPIIDFADAAAAIRRLKAAGVRVALDDFGAGYNSPDLSARAARRFGEARPVADHRRRPGPRCGALPLRTRHLRSAGARGHRGGSRDRRTGRHHPLRGVSLRAGLPVRSARAAARHRARRRGRLIPDSSGRRGGTVTR